MLYSLMPKKDRVLVFEVLLGNEKKILELFIQLLIKLI